MPQNDRLCARCGRPVKTQAENFRLLPGGRLRHTACPPSPQWTQLPATTPAVGLPEMLTLAQVATHLHVSVQTVRRYIRKGLLRARRVPGTHLVLITPQDLTAMLSGEPLSGEPLTRETTETEDDETCPDDAPPP